MILVSVGCQEADPVSVQTTGESPDQSETRLFHKRHDRGVSVLTRNVYVGTTTQGILMAENLTDIPLLATEAFELLQATNFPERAYSLAREIKRTNPALIGLQEISLIRTQLSSDFFDFPLPNAEDVLYDYLAILMQALADYGLKYKVAGIVENFDVEVPMVVGIGDDDVPLLGDIRLTDFDVVLAKEEVVVENVVAQNYQVNLPIEDLGLQVLRGYVALDAKVGHKKIRFVNTHLEALTGDPELDELITQIQVAQVMELVATLANEDKPIVMVGDFNSPAPFGPTYQYVLSEGFHDAWNSNMITCNEEGNTFGHDADLRNKIADFYERIDYVFTRNPGDNPALPTRVIIVGDEYRNKTPSGLWPSDHGGVAAKIKLPLMDDIYVYGHK
jgi:endonuclease/exonuclease/phosphatase family metal-dependent hydrolase